MDKQHALNHYVAELERARAERHASHRRSASGAVFDFGCGKCGRTLTAANSRPESDYCLGCDPCDPRNHRGAGS